MELSGVFVCRKGRIVLDEQRKFFKEYRDQSAKIRTDSCR